VAKVLLFLCGLGVLCGEKALCGSANFCALCGWPKLCPLAIIILWKSSFNHDSFLSKVSTNIPACRDKIYAHTAVCLAISVAVFLWLGAGTDNGTYSEKVDLKYRYVFGKNPFLPSQARLEQGGFVASASFPLASYCRQCHEEAHQQWRESAHANSFRAPFYKKNVDLLIQQKGIEFTRHCEGCHNPIALFSGALTANSTVDRSFDEDGITCMVCHSIQKIQDTSGTGSYVMGVPAVMLNAEGAPITTPVANDEILAHPDRHSRAVMKYFYRSPEFCAACHKAFLPKMLNEYKWQRAFAVYDEWQQSSWSRQTPLPFYQKDVASDCQTCHMPRVQVQSDYGAKNHQLASHRWPGANTAMPFLYGYEDQMKVTEAILKDALAIDIFALSKTESGKERWIAPVDRQNFSLMAGETVTAEVVIQNRKIGHNLVPEQRDFYESWVEFVATDGAGHEFFRSGFIKPDGFLDENAHTYTNRLVSKDGQLLDLHQVWMTKIRAYDNTIPSGNSDLVRFRFRIPPQAAGPITLTAKVNYRRFRRGFTNFILGKSENYPIVEMASLARPLKLGRTEGQWPLPDKTQMLRWNNYGIALLRQQQYWKAADAFRKVVEIDPDYADGYINLAIASYSRLVDSRIDPDGPGNMSPANSSFEKYEPALEYLDQALKRNPASMRAIFYKGLIHRLQNNFPEAIKSLALVVNAYPRFRQARQDLGYAYFVQKNYSLARAQFEALQQINPDDLTACYYLSLIYGYLGMSQQAARQGALYSEHKDDPGAALLGLDFRYRHPEVAHESEPYHLHEITQPLSPRR
jgi:tetratricopeptide (TPR) repeat protein